MALVKYSGNRQQRWLLRQRLQQVSNRVVLLEAHQVQGCYWVFVPALGAFQVRTGDAVAGNVSQILTIEAYAFCKLVALVILIPA